MSDMTHFESQQSYISLKRELLKLSKVKLVKQCKLQRLPANGSKSEMIDRLLGLINKSNKSKTPKAFLTKQSKTSQSVHSYFNNYSRSHKPMSFPMGSDLRLQVNRYKNEQKKAKQKKHPFIDEFQLKPTTVTKIKRISLKKQNKKQKECQYTTYGIGGNHFGEFGLGHTQSTSELIQINKGNKSKNINTVYNGYQYTIYHDTKQNKYWSSGYNSNGQCAFNPFHKNNDNEWILKQKSIEFFNKREIKIDKLCTNIGGSATFWITKKHKIYGHGRNDSYQLGLGHNKNINKPTLIKQISSKYHNIIDIQSAASYSVALSSIDASIKTIVNYWMLTKDINKNISIEMVDEITRYASNNEVYATQHSFFGGDGHKEKLKLSFMNDTQSGYEEKEEDGLDIDDEDDDESNENKSKLEGGWKKLDCFGMKHKIIKIRTGSEHTLFLEDNGVVWCCGDNAFGQLGIGYDDEEEEDDDNFDDDTPSNIEENNVYTPIKIEWFLNNDIKIVDIDCGLYHCLALDEDGRIYSWGHGKRGQCGNGEDDVDMEYIDQPQVIEWFPIYNLKGKTIKCGNYHSMVETMDGKIWLFGSNQLNQCLTFDGKSKVIMPFCINEIIKEKTGKKYIKDVYLGCNNTKIIVH